MKRESQRTHPALLSRLGRHTMSQAPHLRNTLTLADTPNAVRLARLHTEDLLPTWGVPSDIVETVRLLVSELVTNAVQHPQDDKSQDSVLVMRNAAQTFELTLERLRDGVRVAVWDRDPRPPLLKKVGVEAEGGRGIFIVAMMSRSWGSRPAVNASGKVVWAEVGLSPVGHVVAEEEAMNPPGRPAGSNSEVPRAAPADPTLLGRVLVGVREF
ncbi:ATP-binding protein [Streptomyces sp. NPDC006995]|uniref:ATP-binding protein n=1 Tax=Streptomyces sp. NPDC006995 TaxID=3156907 RepID=UPI0033E4BBA0